MYEYVYDQGFLLTGASSQDISAAVAFSLIVNFETVFHKLAPQLCGSLILNCWPTTFDF